MKIIHSHHNDSHKAQANNQNSYHKMRQHAHTLKFEIKTLKFTNM